MMFKLSLGVLSSAEWSGDSHGEALAHPCWSPPPSALPDLPGPVGHRADKQRFLKPISEEPKRLS